MCAFLLKIKKQLRITDSHERLCAQSFTCPDVHRAMTAQMIAKQSDLALGESISISIDQHCRYHVALTWESISHLVCPASLGFHGRCGDKKTGGWYSVMAGFLVCHKHSWELDAKYSCHMFLIPERFSLWGYFAQEGIITERRVSEAPQLLSIYNHLTRKSHKKTSYHK